MATSGNNDDSDVLNKQAQIPLQYLGPVFVKMDDDVESLVPFLLTIGLNNDLTLEAFRFKPKGAQLIHSNDKSIKLEKCWNIM